MNDDRRKYVLDASVLIDYVKTELAVLELAVTHVGEIILPSLVVEAEVDQLDHQACIDRGFCWREPTLEQLFKAADRYGPLSFHDHLTRIVALEENAICVTNDVALRRACEKDDIELMWGLEVMVTLVEIGALSVTEAIKIAEAIHQSNPRHINERVLRRFRHRIRHVGRGEPSLIGRKLLLSIVF